jgi:hypothetical protein
MPVAKYNLTIRNPYEIADEAQVSYTESFFQEFQQADGVADAAVAFGGVTTATLFYLKGDQALTYKLNGSATAMALLANKPLPAYRWQVPHKPRLGCKMPLSACNWTRSGSKALWRKHSAYHRLKDSFYPPAVPPPRTGQPTAPASSSRYASRRDCGFGKTTEALWSGQNVNTAYPHR